MADAFTETAIWMALRQRLESFTTEAVSVLDIAWPASIYKPNAQRGFLAPTISYAKPEDVTISGRQKERRGLFVIRVALPLGTASEKALQVAGGLANHFPDRLPLNYGSIRVKVEGEAEVVGGYRDDNGFWNVPVKINWRTYA